MTKEKMEQGATKRVKETKKEMDSKKYENKKLKQTLTKESIF